MADEEAYKRLRGGAGGDLFSLEAIERLETVGRLVNGGEPVPADAEYPTRGMLVKPRPFAPTNVTGACVILEVLDTPVRFRPGAGLDVHADLRVGVPCANGHVHPLLVERWMFEPYSGLLILGGAGKKPPAGIV